MSKSLVAYFSASGVTARAAKTLAEAAKADLFEIKPETPYTNEDLNWQDKNSRSSVEMRDASSRPAVAGKVANMADYDVIFLGYPVWFGTYAPPVATFLNNVDLRGKKIVPFCTFGSGGLESSVKDLTEKQPNAEILPGYGVRAARMDAMPNEVDYFLSANGFGLKENGFICYTVPAMEEFSEQHPVSEEEAAIFDAAVDGYPMLHAKAIKVASRHLVLDEGMEYLFTAVDLPREDKPDMPPAGEMQVYVTVIDGTAPVFTKVIR